MLPKTGKVFPGGNDRENGGENYAALIAGALRRELGDTHRASKTLMRWTGAAERTVKHWLAGFHGPGGDYLLVLMRESDAVLEAVLTAAGRRDAIVSAHVLEAHGTIAQVIGMVDEERGNRARGADADAGRHDGGAVEGTDDPENDPINGPVNSAPSDGLGVRQRWFIEAISSGYEVGAAALQRRWNVSEKTAKRDLADLKVRGLIEFVGAPRTGRYRLRRK